MLQNCEFYKLYGWIPKSGFSITMEDDGGGVRGVRVGQDGTNFTPSRTVDKSDTEPDKMCSLPVSSFQGS